MKNNQKMTATIALALLLGGMVIGGCSSDSVAPHDETPALTQENAAYQAAMVAMAITEVGPQFMNFTPSKDVYSFTFENYEYVDGQVDLDFRLGGADGTPSVPSLADYAHLYSVSENGLVLSYGMYPAGAMSLTVNYMADLDQDNNTATILAGSGGSFVVGVYTGSYAIDGLVVGGSGYPAGGTLTFTGGAHTLVVTFDGTNTVPVSADGATVGNLNLDDGTYTPVS